MHVPILYGEGRGPEDLRDVEYVRHLRPHPAWPQLGQSVGLAILLLLVLPLLSPDG